MKSNRDRFWERAVKLLGRPEGFEIPTPEEAEAELAAVEDDILTNEQIDAMSHTAMQHLCWEIALNKHEGGSI
jgi:hypothetical protein